MAIKDYDLDSLKLIKVRGLSYYIMPRYVEHYVSKDYEDFSADLLLRYLKSGDTVVDIGAHFGFFSLIASREVGEDGKIYSFEPVKENYEILSRNIKANDLKNISTHNIAVSNDVGVATFKVAEASDSGGFYKHPLTKTLKEVPVKTVTIDHLFKNERVDVIKIDVEGHEIEVLSGATKTFKKNPGVRLLVEFNPDCLINAGHQPEDLLKKLKGLGFDLYLIDEESRSWQRITEQTEKWQEYMATKTYANIFCLPKESALSVVFISHTPVLYGAERALVDLIEGLQSRNTMCHVVIPGEGEMVQELRKRAVSYSILPSAWWTTENKHIVSHEQDLERYNDSESLLRLSSLVGNIHPHLVFTNTMVVPWGGLAAAMNNLPHAWMIHEFGDKDHDFKFDLPYTTTLNLIDLLSSKVFANSKSVAEHISQGVSKSKIETIYQYIHLGRTDSDTNFFERSDSVKLVIIGTISETKGQLDAVKSVVKLLKKKVDIELRIAGHIASNEYLSTITSLIEKEGVSKHVKFIGYLENPYPLVSQSDIVLVCSKNEAFGRVTVEAMALGKPVVGSRSGGTAELITEGVNGLMYEPGNYSDLSDKLLALCQDKKRMVLLGKNGKEFVRKTFSETEYAGKIYNRLLKMRLEINPLSPIMGWATKPYTHEQGLEKERVRLAGELEHSEQARQDLGTALDQKETLLGQKMSELHGIYGSRSWKVAQAIKKVVNILRFKR